MGTFGGTQSCSLKMLVDEALRGNVEQMAKFGEKTKFPSGCIADGPVPSHHTSSCSLGVTCDRACLQ